jgi:Flp pilus assembly protein TadD
MSIILKALKSSGQDEARTTNDEALPEGEGFFRGRQSFIKGASSANLGAGRNKRVYYLTAALIVLTAISIVSRYIASKKADVGLEPVVPPQAQTAAEPAAAPPSQQAQEAQTDANAAQEAARAFEAGDYDSSIRYFRAAIENDPMNSKLHNDLGLAFLKKELYSSAEDEYKKALEYDSNCSECFNNLGMLKSLLGESVEAKKYLERAISLSSAYPDPYFNLAVLSEKEGDFSGAVRYYRQFMSIYPDKNDVLLSKINRRVDELAGR